MSEPRRVAGRASRSPKAAGSPEATGSPEDAESPKAAGPAKTAGSTKAAGSGKTGGHAKVRGAGKRDKPAGPTGRDWRSQADRIAVHARDFLDALAALGRGEGGDEIVPLLLLEVAQVMLAGAQLGASMDVIPPGNAEPDVGADPDLDELRTGLAERLAACDEYAELFDPYRDAKPTAFRLSDDLAAVAMDLIHGMRHYQAGRRAEALWWWQYSYVNHWGTHGGAALRALHAVVAHARLDVAEEEIPG
jgi:hypothetical protein